jgi:transcriptional regulator with XRE-family HTH domain|tara:strand:+ start:49 stop:288 length:240 start_codon:yes stop_codon:yes gene_type:complete
MSNKGNRLLPYSQKKELKLQIEDIQEDLSSLREKLSDRRLKVVAERIGMTYAALSRIMRGGKPSRRTIDKLQKYLNNEK